MRGKTLKQFLVCGSLLVFFIGPLTIREQDQASVEVLVERVERVSLEEAHLWLKISNKGHRPVFLAGINYESGPRPEFVFIEQLRLKKGWKGSCYPDVPPPHVIRLNQDEFITRVLRANLPMPSVCRERIIRLEGKFRFRVEYFDSEEHMRAYIDYLFGRTGVEVKPRIAVSAPFEIPPTLNSAH